MTTSPEVPDPWLRRYHRAPEPRATLFCFPHAGGSATYFHPVSAMLTPEFDVVAVQYPGRQDRHAEPPIQSIEELADAVSAVIGPELTRPAAFFGHSMGAIVAFEVALRLEERGEPGPVMLFASGSRAPSRVRDDGVHRRGDDGVIAELGTLGGTDARVLSDPELLEMVLPALRNDYRAIETYRQSADAVISAPIIVLAAQDDTRVSVPEATAWHEHSRVGGAQHLFSGGHFYLESHAQTVVGIIADGLRAPRDAGAPA